jgi:hypothetical protein
MSNSNDMNVGPGWKRAERAATRGPGSLAVYVIGFVMLMSAGIGVVGWFAGWFSEAAQVAQEQFGPRAALEKYNYLKRTAASLAEKQNNIAMLQARLDTFKKDYGDRSKADWPRDERTAYNQAEAELTGVKLSYNTLAAEYNAMMASFNWSFAKAGQLPKGAEQVLPGEGAFAPFIDK